MLAPAEAIFDLKSIKIITPQQNLSSPHKYLRGRLAFEKLFVDNRAVGSAPGAENKKPSAEYESGLGLANSH